MHGMAASSEMFRVSVSCFWRYPKRIGRWCCKTNQHSSGYHFSLTRYIAFTSIHLRLNRTLSRHHSILHRGSTNITPFNITKKASSSDYRSVPTTKLIMEKYTDSSSSQGDTENTAFITTQYQREDRQRRSSYIYLTLFNLFLFTLSMLSLICSVMSQKNFSGHSAAKLMDQFDVFCMSLILRRYDC
jgi:hypothetical protein